MWCSCYTCRWSPSPIIDLNKSADLLVKKKESLSHVVKEVPSFILESGMGFFQDHHGIRRDRAKSGGVAPNTVIVGKKPILIVLHNLLFANIKGVRLVFVPYGTTYGTSMWH